MLNRFLHSKWPVRTGIAILLVAAAAITGILQNKPKAYADDAFLEIWWPANNVHVAAVQPFKAMLKDHKLDEYTMFWQADNDRLNEMANSFNDYPHKESTVDLTSWHWHTDGLYPVSFIAKDSAGNIIAKKTITLLIGNENLAGAKDANGADVNTAGSVASSDVTGQAIALSLNAPGAGQAGILSTPNNGSAGSSTQSANAVDTSVSASIQHKLDIWWPTDGVTVSGTEPFRAMVEDSNVADYQMYWQTDGSELAKMDNNSQDYPHKESDVNVDNFSSVPGNRHTINFVVKDLNGNFVQQKSVVVVTNNTAPAVKEIAPPVVQEKVTTQSSTTDPNATAANTAPKAAALIPTPEKILTPSSTAPTAAPEKISNNNVSNNANNSNSNDKAHSAYASWKAKYVTANGASGNLRVVRPENNNDTVSEGQGYGMLAALAAGDQATFDALWRYTQSHLNTNGLMAWHIASNDQPVETGAATDADEDIAFALLRADSKWGGYGNDARMMINNIFDHEVEHKTSILKPGDVWGGTDAINISYFAPAYYKAFAAFTGNNKWNNVVDKGYQIINTAQDQSTGLVPDWTNASGNSTWYDMGINKNNFFYDAVRTPLRLAMDAKWYGDPRAKAQLNKMSKFFANIGADNLKSGYTLSGEPLSGYFDDTFISCIAAGASASQYQTFASQMKTKMENNVPGSYFGTSLRLISLMFMGGQLSN